MGAPARSACAREAPSSAQPPRSPSRLSEPPQLTNYTQLTQSLALPSPVANAVHAALTEAKDMGLGDKFVASLITAQEKKTGLKITSL